MPPRVDLVLAAHAGDDRDAHIRRDAGGTFVRRGLRDCRTPDPQVRSVELLEVELGEAEPGSACSRAGASFSPAATRSGSPGGARRASGCGAAAYTIRVVAYPGDGTRRQADTIEYRVR